MITVLPWFNVYRKPHTAHSYSSGTVTDGGTWKTVMQEVDVRLNHASATT